MTDFFKRYSKIMGEGHTEKIRQQGYVAAQIKTRRRDMNLSQQQLADLIGKPKSTIGRIEAGLTVPRIDTLYDISRALNMPFIIDGSDKPNSDSSLYIQA